MEFQSIPGIPKTVSTNFRLQYRNKQQLNYTQGNFIFTCSLFLPISNRNRQKHCNLAAPPYTEKSNCFIRPSPARETRSERQSFLRNKKIKKSPSETLFALRADENREIIMPRLPRNLGERGSLVYRKKPAVFCLKGQHDPKEAKSVSFGKVIRDGAHV